MEQTIVTRRRRVVGFWWGTVTLALLAAVAALIIVNLAVAGRLDWAFIPLGAIGLAWCVLTALAFGGRARLIAALTTLSLLVFPFLRLVEAQVGGAWLGPVAVPIALASLGLLWLAMLLLRYTRLRRMACTGILALCVIGLLVVVDRAIATHTGQPADVLTFWNVLTLTGIAAVQFLVAAKVRYA